MIVLSLQQGMGEENQAGLMAQVSTRTWLVANENLVTAFSGDKNAVALSFLSGSVKGKG